LLNWSVVKEFYSASRSANASDFFVDINSNSSLELIVETDSWWISSQVKTLSFVEIVNQEPNISHFWCYRERHKNSFNCNASARDSDGVISDYSYFINWNKVANGQSVNVSIESNSVITLVVTDSWWATSSRDLNLTFEQY
jgi:hypothetical protein